MKKYVFGTVIAAIVIAVLVVVGVMQLRGDDTGAGESAQAPGAGSESGSAGYQDVAERPDCPAGPIAGVIAPGERIRGKGLYFAATPASDFICGALQMAAVMNLHVFTTGRGTPYGLAQVPVIKVATRSDLARRWHDLMDVDAGRIATGDKTIEEVGWELFHLILDVASGRKRPWSDRWGLFNDLTLFNPAPIT